MNTKQKSVLVVGDGPLARKIQLVLGGPKRRKTMNQLSLVVFNDDHQDPTYSEASSVTLEVFEVEEYPEFQFVPDLRKQYDHTVYDLDKMLQVLKHNNLLDKCLA